MAGRSRLVALLVALLAGVAAMLVGSVSSDAAPPYSHKPHISCNPHANVHSVIHCDGDGYLSNDHVVITLHTKTYTLGATDTNAAGAFHHVALQLPAGVTGTHTITGTGRGGPQTDSASTQIVITAPGGLGTAGQSTGGNGTGGLSNTGIAIISLGVLGVGLIGAGGLVLMSSRRRRRALA